MLISDYIQQHGLKATHDYMVSKPGCALLLRAIPTPDEIPRFIREMNLVTVDDFNALVTSIHKNIPLHHTLADLITPLPTFPLHSATKLPFNPTIHALINQQYTTRPDCKFSHADLKNSLLPEAHLRWLADNCPSKHRAWNSGDEKRDCDNSVYMARGWLHSLGATDIACGSLSTLHYQGNTVLYAHVVLALVDDQQKVWQWDTMQGGLYPASEVNLGNQSSRRADRMEVFEVFF